MHLIGVYLIGVYLMGMHLMGMHLKGVAKSVGDPWMAGVSDRRYEAIAPPVPTTAIPKALIIVREQYIANVKKTTYNEDRSKQKSILQTFHFRLHPLRDGFNETFHLYMKVFMRI
jgi:hypothetical protein